MVSALDRSRILHRRSRETRRGVFYRHPAAQRHRTIAPWACAQRHAAGHHRSHAQDAGLQHVMGPRHRSRRHRDPERGRKGSREGRQESPSARARQIREARLGVARDLRQSDSQSVGRLGASCDWSRERFTLDEGLSRAVNEVFIRLYKEGLIYKDRRLINWCPRCETALSDLEVDHKDRTGTLWYIKYPLVDGSGYIEVATTRPETMLGDTAVAVNPEDNRYRSEVARRRASR